MSQLQLLLQRRGGELETPSGTGLKPAARLPGSAAAAEETATEVLVSLGMTAPDARSLLERAACEHQSTSTAALAAHRPTGGSNGSRMGSSSTSDAGPGTQGSADEASALRPDLSSSSSSIQSGTWVLGQSVEDISAVQAQRVCGWLTAAGVPVGHLAAVLRAHPAALLANPDQEWLPKVSATCYCVSAIEQIGTQSSR